MTETTTESNVISLDEFRKTHPKPSGKLYRDPKRKNGKQIRQDKQASPTQKADAKKSSNAKLAEAMRKYGSDTGNVMKQQFKKKEPLVEDN